MSVRASREPAQRERARRHPHNRVRLSRTVYPYRKPQSSSSARFFASERVALKNSTLKTHTKSTAEALRTRSSPAPPCCCCGCPPPRPAPVDSSWSNLEKLVSYSLCARGKRPPGYRRVSHSFIHSSFDTLAPVVVVVVVGDGKSPVRHPSRAGWRWRWREPSERSRRRSRRPRSARRRDKTR